MPNQHAVGTRWVAVIIILLFANVALLGCSSHSPLAIDQTGQALTSTSVTFARLAQSGQAVTVTMRPQQPVAPPRGISASFGPVQFPVGTSTRKVSYDPADLTKTGDGYEVTSPSNLVTINDTNARFAPDWDGASSTSAAGLAYCTYRFALDGYDASPDNLTTIGFEWAVEPAAWSNVWVGIADHSHDTWQWYSGPDDLVLTVDTFDGYYYENGDLLVLVLLTGTGETPELARITIGQEEIRGTGADLPDTTPPVVPPLAEPTGGLPASIDLSPGCAPINDQKWWPSCTCFSIGDSAYNYELNRIYGDYGWDFSNPLNRISPKYMYVISGEFQGWHPPAPPPYHGRWFDYDMQPLWDFGQAMEWHAPYDMHYNNNWDPEAENDAAVLTIDSWEYIPTQSAEGLVSAKVILAVHRLPLVIGALLDSNFGGYEPGTVWNYVGPQAGAHAMLIVGYDDAKQAFKVRNSWGTDWGDEGYCWIGYDTFANPSEYTIAFVLHDSYSQAVAERFCGQQPALQPPAAVRASDGRSYEHIRVTWDEVTQATGYDIFRDDPMGDPVASVGAEYSWIDTGITDLMRHTYWVRSVNGEMLSPLSSPDTGYRTTPGAGDWYALGHDRGNSCYSTQNGPQSKPGESVFVTDIPNGADFKIVIGADGALYCGRYDGLLQCLDPDTGDERWSANLTNNVRGLTIGTDGTVYAISWQATASCYLYAYNPDGTPKWTTAALSPGTIEGPTLGADGTIYVGGRNTAGTEAVLYAITDTGTGYTIDWEFPTGRLTINDIPLVGADGRIYLAVMDDSYSNAQQICVIDNGDHATEDYRTPPGPANAESEVLCVTPDNILLAGTYDKKLTAYNSDGTERWQSTTAASWGHYWDAGLTSDGLIIARYDNYMLALVDNDDSATELWTSDELKSATIAIGRNDTIYCQYKSSTGDNLRVAAFDPLTGEALWTWSQGMTYKGYSSPIVIGNEGELFVPCFTDLLCLR
ncbi:PQQ-binding-like beta-propeller repeat protein [bacterium]|nr:PQQ-binding-like beta-propeller repeat protein [bacterium]